jgi:hypothetical protein
MRRDFIRDSLLRGGIHPYAAIFTKV